MKRGFWKSIWYVVSLTCDESSRLLSDAMDRDLTSVERTALRMHNLTCKSCRRFIEQLEFLRRAASGAVLSQNRKALSPEARNRLRESIRQASGEGD